MRWLADLLNAIAAIFGLHLARKAGEAEDREEELEDADDAKRAREKLDRDPDARRRLREWSRRKR